jgi:hypothetical protein|nr:hypothetical protein [Clostridium sp. KNHs205]
MTVIIPIIEAATGKTLITGDYLTGDEQAFKVVSGVVSLVTLGYGAAIAKGGGALAKMFAADILAEIEAKNISMPEWDFSNPSTMEVWDLASGAYAEQVSGEIRAVLDQN